MDMLVITDEDDLFSHASADVVCFTETETSGLSDDNAECSSASENETSSMVSLMYRRFHTKSK